MNQEQIGKWIALLRKEKRMTQEQLAERLGVSNRSVSRWENGRCMPDFSLLWDIADELDVSVSELLNGKRAEGDMGSCYKTAFAEVEKCLEEGESAAFAGQAKDIIEMS